MREGGPRADGRFDTVGNLIGFYRRLPHAIEHKHIDKSLVPKMFGPPFVWWYVVVFEHSLVPLDENVWDGCREIKWLHEWFSGHPKYAAWKGVADKDLTLRLAPARASGLSKGYPVSFPAETNPGTGFHPGG